MVLAGFCAQAPPKVTSSLFRSASNDASSVSATTENAVSSLFSLRQQCREQRFGHDRNAVNSLFAPTAMPLAACGIGWVTASLFVSAQSTNREPQYRSLL